MVAPERHSPTPSPSTALARARPARSPPPLRDYRSIAAPTCSRLRADAPGGHHDRAGRTLVGAARAGGTMSNRTRLKILTILHGVMERARRVWKLPRNPVTDVEKPTHGAAPRSRSSRPRRSTRSLGRAGLRARRRDLPDRGLHWPAPRRARRAALARRRLHRSPPPRHPPTPSEPVHAQVGKGALRPDGARRRRGPARLAARGAHRRRRPRLPRHRRGFPRRHGPLPSLQGRAQARRAADLRFHDLRHTFGTQVIGNPRVRSSSSRSGWDTQTSTPR